MGGGLSLLQKNGFQKGRDTDYTKKTLPKSTDFRRSTLSQHRNSIIVTSPQVCSNSFQI